MPLPQATEDFYTTMQRYQLLMLDAGRRLWRGMLPGDFDASWSRVAPQLVTFTAGAQLAAARAGSNYVAQVLDEQGTPVDPIVSVRPQAFSGVASDGRSLPGLLEGAVVASKRATMPRTYEDEDGRPYTVRGMDGGDALKLGQKWLEQALQTAVMDAARDACAAEIVARPQVRWIRVVNPPCCSRCAVLAADVYYWNQPLPRHPRCDCFALPTTVANADRQLTNPRELFDKGLITDLSRAQRERIEGGADMVKVLNESRDRWRERMSADRRAERYANYTDAERRAADRRATRRAGNGLVVPQGWAGGGTNPPPVGTTIHELMARLTNQVEAGLAMRAAGLAE